MTEEDKVADTSSSASTVRKPIGTKGGKGKSGLTSRQVAQIEAMWTSGDYSAEQIGKKFDRTGKSIMNIMKARGAKKGERSEMLSDRVREKMEEKIVTEATIISDRIRETKEEHYKMTAAITKLAWREVAKAEKEGRSFATITGSMKGLSLAMGILEKARMERYAILGLDAEKDDDGDIPELVINELTQDQIEELRNRDFSAPGQRDAEVLLEEVLESEAEMNLESDD